MINNILHTIKNLDKKVTQIMTHGFRFAFIVCAISSLILLIYITIGTSPKLYYIGIQIFKLGLMFLVEFIICGFAFDKIKRDFTC